MIDRRAIIALAGITTAVVLIIGTIMPTITADKVVYATERSYTVEQKKPEEPKPVDPKPPPMNGNKELCLTIVSDTTTFVDRGNTVVATYSQWPTITGATYIWSSNGLDTSNPYTFTKPFILPSGYTYWGRLWITADDQWTDLKMNGNFIASESISSWQNIHLYQQPTLILASIL